MNKEKSKSDKIGDANTIKALAGFAILIPLLLFVWGHSVAGISIEIVFVLSVIFLIVYFYLISKYKDKIL